MDYEERKAKMLDMRAKRMTLQAIGDKMGISRERVRQEIGNTGHQAEVYILPEEEQKIVEMRKSGLLGHEIVDKLGRTYNSVARVLKKHELPYAETNAVLFQQGKRKCSGKCHQVKPISEFGPCEGYPQGLATRCRECNRANSRFYYRKSHGPISNLQ
jgi:hypothetical protein